jgi:hypothetical protein
MAAGFVALLVTAAIALSLVFLAVRQLPWGRFAEAAHLALPDQDLRDRVQHQRL